MYDIMLFSEQGAHQIFSGNGTDQRQNARVTRGAKSSAHQSNDTVVGSDDHLSDTDYFQQVFNRRGDARIIFTVTDPLADVVCIRSVYGLPVNSE